MDSSVWYEQVDIALIRFIQSCIHINGNPCKTKVRKPEEDFNVETYPLVSIYALYDRFSAFRYCADKQVVSRNPEANTMVLEDSALPFDLYYQVDFWATKQTDMNSMLKQWKMATQRYFNLTVIDESGTERSCFVLLKGDFAKSDLLNNGNRVFHCFETFRIYTELDDNKQSEVPMVTKTLDPRMYEK